MEGRTIVGVKIITDPKQADRVKDRFDRLNREFSNTDKLLREIGGYMEKKWMEAFENEGRYEKWVRSPTAEKEGRKILQKSGALKESGRIGTADNLFEIEGNRARYGSRLGYGKYHQSDKPRKTANGGKPKIPRRIILEHRAEDQENVRKIVREWAKEGIKTSRKK